VLVIAYGLNSQAVQEKQEAWEEKKTLHSASSFLASALPASSYKGLFSASSFPPDVFMEIVEKIQHPQDEKLWLQDT